MADEGQVEQLVALNLAIGEAEDRADRAFFEQLLCRQFVMQRPTGRLDDREALMAGLSTGSCRRTSEVQVTLHPANRAVVTCRVDKWDAGPAEPPPEGVDHFDNLRVFIRDGVGAPWRLLAWLNEPLLDDPVPRTDPTTSDQTWRRP